MTIDEVFTKLITHMSKGIQIHNLFSQAYDFLGLYGFSKCHEYHYLDEIQGQQCLLHYFSHHYHKLVTIETFTVSEIIPESWRKYTTMAVDSNTIRQAVKDLMEKWVQWERDTKLLYQQMYQELVAINEIAAAEKIKCYILDVTEELKHAEKKIIKLESLGYDINTIIKWQQPMYKKYKKKRW